MAVELSKWYLDCVTAQGEPAIVYVAELRWRGSALRYSSVLDGETVRSAVGGDEPAVDGRVISWRSRDLEVSGSWTALDPPVESWLHEAVHWRCLQPRARVRVRLAKREFDGLGYVEHVRLTIAPWKLPIRTLGWGRFLHDGGYVVWIHRDDRRLCWSSGGEAFEELAFGETRTLREGTLGSAALSSIPGVNRTLPARVLNIHETKWLSRARLGGPGHAGAEGWAIHEVVKWPGE